MRMLFGLLFLFTMLVPAFAEDVERGAELFAENCATCHGAEAIGDGPMTEILSVQPPDLTSLSARNGGEFPLERVVRHIDGRDTVVLAHGGPMPVFGSLLQGESGVIDAADGTPIFTPQPVVDLAAWLRTIQQ